MKLIVSGTDRGDHTSVDQKICPRDEPRVFAQKESACLRDLIGSAGPFCCGSIDHSLISFTGRIKLIISQRGHDDAGTDGIDPCTPGFPCGGCRFLCLQLVDALGDHVGQAGILHSRFFGSEAPSAFL